MELKQIVSDDDAVSPVIGVILMVAITVILAAVIASFVLGLGDSVQNTTPQASFSFDYDASPDHSTASPVDLYNSTTESGDGGDLTITHDGGDTIANDRLSIVDDDGSSSVKFGTEVSAGVSKTLAVGGDDTVRIIYTGESGDTSSTLGKWNGPEA